MRQAVVITPGLLISKPGLLPIPIFPDESGKRIWRREVHQPLNWRPDSDEKKLGPKTGFPDCIHIVTVTENIPAERIELFRKAVVAARGQTGDLLLGDNYDSAVAVYNGHIVGVASADTGWSCKWQWRLTREPHRQFDPGLGFPVRPMVRGISVHPEYRGLAIGRQLIGALAQHFNRPVGEMGYRLPVSAKATRMLQATGLDMIIGAF